MNQLPLTPKNRPDAPKPDLVKHLASKGAKPVWILLGITIVTLPDLLKNGWWLAPCITALIWKYM